MFFIPLLLSLSTLLSAQTFGLYEKQCEELCDFCDEVYHLKTPACSRSMKLVKEYEAKIGEFGAAIRQDALFVARDSMLNFCQTFLKAFDCLPCGDNNQQNNTAPIDNRSTSNLTSSNESYEEVIDEANVTSNVITQDSSNGILN